MRQDVKTTKGYDEVGAYVCNKKSEGSEEGKVVYVYLGIYKMWQCIAPQEQIIGVDHGQYMNE